MPTSRVQGTCAGHVHLHLVHHALPKLPHTTHPHSQSLTHSSPERPHPTLFRPTLLSLSQPKATTNHGSRAEPQRTTTTPNLAHELLLIRAVKLLAGRLQLGEARASNHRHERNSRHHQLWLLQHLKWCWSRFSAQQVSMATRGERPRGRLPPFPQCPLLIHLLF